MAANGRSSFRRRVLRYTGYDYALAGTYFITVCTQGRVESLASIEDSVVALTAAGAIVDHELQNLPNRFSFVTIEEYVVMPNHVHCVLTFGTREGREFMPGHLGSVVRAFKAASTRSIRTSGFIDFAWQPNYYDHIVRTQADLGRIREYIAANPSKWEEDPQNPRRQHGTHEGIEPWAQ